MKIGGNFGVSRTIATGERKVIPGSLQTTLGQLVERGEGFIQTGPFGSQLHAHDYVEDGIPVVMPQQLGDNEIDADGISQIGEHDRDRLIRHVMCEGDIVFSRRGDVTRRAYITAKENGWLCGTGCLLLRLNHPQCDNRYLVRFLGLHEARSYLTQHAIGATMPNLNQGILASVPVVLPPREHQKRIIDVISAYDDLIENNRRRIQLLEQAARLLYKEWFVRLRFPGHEHVKIKDGVPEGWERKTVADVCTSFEDGDWIESKDQGGEDFRLLQISNIGNNDFVETGNFRYITFETFRNLRCNEVLPGDILISRMPKPIGRAWLVYEQPWQMITAVDVTIARPNPDIVDPFYYLYHLNSPLHIARCELRATGATRPRVSRKNIGALPILRPPMSLQHTFGQAASAINEQRNILIRQDKLLAQARDLLLPRLMSGEIVA